MNKKLLFLVLGCFFAVGALQAGPVQDFLGIKYRYTETFAYKVPYGEEHKWKLVTEVKDGKGYALKKWVPRGETLKHFTEQRIILFTAHKTKNFDLASKIVQTIFRDQRQETPNLTYTIIDEAPHDVIFEWAYQRAGFPKERIFSRCVTTAKGMHYAAYHKMGNTTLTPEQKEIIIGCLRTSKIVKR